MKIIYPSFSPPDPKPKIGDSIVKIRDSALKDNFCDFVQTLRDHAETACDEAEDDPVLKEAVGQFLQATETLSKIDRALDPAFVTLDKYINPDDYVDYEALYEGRILLPTG